jgi:hypothetical protein
MESKLMYNVMIKSTFLHASVVEIQYSHLLPVKIINNDTWLIINASFAGTFSYWSHHKQTGNVRLKYNSVMRQENNHSFNTILDSRVVRLVLYMRACLAVCSVSNFLGRG